MKKPNVTHIRILVIGAVCGLVWVHYGLVVSVGFCDLLVQYYCDLSHLDTCITFRKVILLINRLYYTLGMFYFVLDKIFVPNWKVKFY